MSYTSANGGAQIHANLTPAYSSNSAYVQSWTRDLDYAGNTLRIHDICSVSSDVKPVFQVHVPVLPVLQPDGSLHAGNLKIKPVMSPVPTVNIVDMHALDSDFNSGYRVEYTIPSGCDFTIELQALN